MIKIRVLNFLKLLVFSLIAGMNYASANVLPNLTLEDKAAQSDVVVIGKIIGAHSAVGKSEPYSLVEIEIIFKGSTSKNVKIFPRSYYFERSINCCLIGRRYMFFLKRINGNDFRVLYGRNGVFLIPVE